MQFPQIQMESQLARIGINQSLGRQELHQPKTDVAIEQPKANLAIETIPAKLTIDQSVAWEQMNLKSTARHIEERAQEGNNSILQGMARRAQQGNELMRIEKEGNPIANQALVNGHSQMKSLGITFIPSPFAVNLNYEPAQVNIDATVNHPVINAQVNKPTHHYERGNVHIFMDKYEQLDIDVHLFSATI